MEASREARHLRPPPFPCNPIILAVHLPLTRSKRRDAAPRRRAACATPYAGMRASSGHLGALQCPFEAALTPADVRRHRRLRSEFGKDRP